MMELVELLIVAISSSVAGYFLGYRTCQEDLINRFKVDKLY